MTNTTPEFWDADGVSLQTYAQNIEQWGGSRQGVPPLRGADTLIPYVPGESWNPKVPGPRVITIAGWLVGTNSDSTPVANPERTFRSNWRDLRNLLWRSDRQVALTKRWRDIDGTAHSATAQVEFAGGLEPDTFSPSGAKFTTDLKLAFPYYKGADVATGSHSGSFTINNVGDDTTRLMTLSFSTGASLTNVTTGRVLLVPDAATVVVGSFTTTGNLENIAPSGQPAEAYWMSLVRGVNSMALNTGSVTITYTPLYL